ncbi:flagellar motor protein [bacterium]|nr:flagellar motor protein [bacterium]NBX82147.1 flagellar motor protein [bacterium]
MIVSCIGLFLGMFAVIGGAVIEGLHLSALTQPTAALIVFGGTLGATMLACTGEEFSGALKLTPKIFLGKAPDFSGLIKEIVELANLARKDGLLALEKSVATIKHPFLSQNLRKIVDGYDPVILREMMEEKIFKTEEHANAVGKVFETGGGFSPTVGIIGAVLGLIHVMGNLSDSSKLGSGIAVAFVATVYGVGLANLILIPMGNKAKKIGKYEAEEMEIICTGLLAIQAGLNPRLIEDRLNNLHADHGKHAKAEAGGQSAAPESKAA